MAKKNKPSLLQTNNLLETLTFGCLSQSIYCWTFFVTTAGFFAQCVLNIVKQTQKLKLHIILIGEMSKSIQQLIVR